MPKIAAQHDPSQPLCHDADYTPSFSWPESALAQWGSGRSWGDYGVEERNTLAFFEVFLRDSMQVSFRGEGVGILDAERAAHEAYQRFLDCQHEWTRKFDEHSGVGCCANCDAIGIKVFEEKERPESTTGPLSPDDLNRISMGFMKPGSHSKFGEKYEVKVAKWREAATVKGDRQNFSWPDTLLEKDIYVECCRDAVAAFWHENRAWYESYAAALPCTEDFMNPLDVGQLDYIAARFLENGETRNDGFRH